MHAAVAGGHSCVAVVLHEGCCSVMGFVDVLDAVMAVAIEFGIAIHVGLSQWLFRQWCHAPVYSCWLGRRIHSRSSKTGIVRFGRSHLSEPSSGSSKKCCMSF